MKKFKYRFIFLLLLFLINCSEKKGKEVERSFYFWKSSFQLTGKEKASINDLKVNSLFIKYFDVIWDKERLLPIPIAQVTFKEKPQQKVVPVVFITNEVFKYCNESSITVLSGRIADLIKKISANSGINDHPEIQVDCDWTEQTKDKYFLFLTALHQEPFMHQKLLSATIRLHQLKFSNRTGIPPVDKGLLMCYNMGNLKAPEVENSILDYNELQKYISNLPDYPLPVDVALPIFDWYVWFRQEKFKGLISNTVFKNALTSSNKILFKRDTFIGGYKFEAGDWIRYEGSTPSEVLRAARLLNRRLVQKNLKVILYHLDQNNLNNYSINELEAIYSSFR